MDPYNILDKWVWLLINRKLSLFILLFQNINVITRKKKLYLIVREKNNKKRKEGLKKIIIIDFNLQSNLYLLVNYTYQN